MNDISYNDFKVTIYIVNHNYGMYIEECIKSVLAQTFDDYEVIIFDCGSTDNSKKIIQSYSNRKNFKTIYLNNQPLAMTNNIAISMSRAEYLIRLDADDFLHENAIGILSGILDRNTALGLVFPDYYEIDAEGNISSLVRRHNFKNVTLKDQPAHGACTLIRKSILEKVGGYDEEFTCQDGWDLWLKVTDISEVFNTNLPLFYYRQHNNNLTKDETKLLRTRSEILAKYNKNKGESSKGVAIIPIRGGTDKNSNYWMTEILNKPLLDRAIDTALSATSIYKVVVSSPDQNILNYVEKKYKEAVLIVKREMTKSFTHEFLDETIFQIMGLYSDLCNNMAGLIINIEYPFLNENDFDSAVNSLKVFNTDLVLGVRKESRNVYQHSGHGLSNISKKTNFTNEKNETYIAGGLQAFRFSALNKLGSLNKIDTIGHIILDERSFYHLSSNFSLELLNNIEKFNK